jgi:tRNA pseudouridine55 synthase
MRRGASDRDLDGILLLDKPAGPSSNQAMQRARRILAARKAGHAGTLDPLATGLLPILLGEATKFARYVADAHKVYEATILLGVTTATGDLAGDVLARQAVNVSSQLIHEVAAKFLGDIIQVPPMHSALKVKGRALYKLARRGETIERAERRVTIAELSVGEVRGDEFDIWVRCSKGTYIRVLAEDIGRALGCGATLKRLRRTSVGPFDIGTAVTLDTLEKFGSACNERFLLPVDAAITELPELRLDSSAAERVQNGQTVAANCELAVARVRLYDAQSRRFIGLGEVVAGTLYPRRLVASATG